MREPAKGSLDATVRCPPGGWCPDAIAAALGAVIARLPHARTPLGESFLGRPIDLVTVGHGPRRVLMWSQMHGDEPTHTTALLNLLHGIAAEEPSVARLTRGLTLGMVFPLNPDGAHANTRQNAQGIDVNRDFGPFATSEARALRDAFAGFRPDYALNLHNQPHRRAMPDAPRRPASLSLQVPPCDADDTPTDSVREATRVAAALATIGADLCGGRVSRYPADWMPLASGDWAQSRGVPTVLVEAGGWPANDFASLERAHSVLLAQTLDAIAATALGEPGGLESFDPAAYLALPRSSPKHLFDLHLRPGGVAQRCGAGEALLVGAPIGIDFPSLSAGAAEPAGGVFAALGDLEEQGGVETIESPDLVLPGRIARIDAPRSGSIDWARLADSGVTTALVVLDLADATAAERLGELTAAAPGVNAAVVASWGTSDADPTATLHALASAIAAGALATIGPLPDPVPEACRRLGLPSLSWEEIPAAFGPVPTSIDAWLAEAAMVAEQLGRSDRGAIRLGTAADFVLSPAASPEVAIGAVYVNGIRFVPGAAPSGRWLRR